jgi:hypothetical protein
MSVKLSNLGSLFAPLDALGRILDAEGQTCDLVVVGGVAILARGFRSRTTNDVDIIARAVKGGDGTKQLVPPDPLPDGVRRAVARVARDFGLSPQWLNTVVGKQWRQTPVALPPALIDEIAWYSLGGLRLGIAGRQSLIALKLFAAVDRGPNSVHVEDLVAIEPTDEELDRAASWVELQDAAPDFPTQVAEVVAHVKAKR